MGQFELQTCTDGSVTLKDLEVDEAMHSHLGPYVEATALYVEQSRLSGRLAQRIQPLVIYDVGLGIAANAIAAIDHAGIASPVRIHSFENNPDGLRIALENIEQIPWLKQHQEKAQALVTHGRWESTDGRIQWTLHEGDFRNVKLPDERPELIFFDFYSPKTSPELWTHAVFKRLRDHSTDTSLFTYSASTSVRAAMILAGWKVGYGAGTAAKRETTVASTDWLALSHPLDEKWRHRFLHSTHALPLDRDSEEARTEVLRLLDAYVSIQTHPKR